MNSVQYEELCRFYIASELGILIDTVKSIRVPSPSRPGLPHYAHQIDLYWETEDKISKYLNIANAKWRKTDKADQPDVLLLQQVKQKVAAHKAIMLTNTGFTAGAKAAAQDDGIGLHIVKPLFDYTLLPNKDRVAIQEALRQIAAPIANVYNVRVAYKSIEIDPDKDDRLVQIADPIEQLVLATFERRLKYLRQLAAEGHPIAQSDISELERKIAQKKAQFKSQE